jgi:hypothetical protein
MIHGILAGELHPLVILIEGRGLLAEGIVDVVGDALSAGAGDQAGSAQVVEVEVALTGLGLGGQEEAVAVQIVRPDAPRSGSSTG